MPAKKSAASKRKPAAKRKSSTTTRRKSSTASKPRSRSCSTGRCTPRSGSASCVGGCRSPWMQNEFGSCGPVACVDENGNPLKGYVRNSQGNCAPKKCGAGYVFNYATGKCVTQNSHMGQQLMAVKKYNDAKQAQAEAKKIIDHYDTNSPWENGSAEAKTYGLMMQKDGGGVAAAQRQYAQQHAEYQKQRQQDYETQMAALQAQNLQHRIRSYPVPVRPVAIKPTAKSNSPWASMW